MPNNETKPPEPKWWKPYWIILVISIIILGITMPYFTSIPFETSIFYMIITLIGLGIAYLVRVKQSIQINKMLYIILGICIAFPIWMISIPIQNRLYAQGYNDWLIFIVGLVGWFGVGCLIGFIIGRARNWKGPERYQP